MGVLLKLTRDIALLTIGFWRGDVDGAVFKSLEGQDMYRGKVGLSLAHYMSSMLDAVVNHVAVRNHSDVIDRSTLLWLT